MLCSKRERLLDHLVGELLKMRGHIEAERYSQSPLRR